MNSDPKQKRERFQQLTQNPKVKTGKVFAADLRKSQIHPTVKKRTASHTAAILEKFLLDHPTVESPKKLKQPR